MRRTRALHRWSVSPREAVEIQKRLARRVRAVPPRGEIRRVAGVDATFTPDGRHALAGVVLWDLRDGEVIEQHTARARLTFPYVPGLLSFREAPALLRALRKLREMPHAVLCDGHGIAHPRRFGLACHVGLQLEVPAVGCAKSRLVGEHRVPAASRGSRTALVHRGERVGTVLRTRDGVKPVFVSVGHRFDLPGAERLVLACASRFRLPEPIRRADRLVAAARRGAAPG